MSHPEGNFSILSAITQARGREMMPSDPEKYGIEHTPESPVIDIGPIATAIPAHDEFPSEPEVLVSSLARGGFTPATDQVEPTPSAGQVESTSATDQVESTPSAGQVESIPATDSCIVGGMEYSVGGWGQYEADRRRAQWGITKSITRVGGADEEDSEAGLSWKEIYGGRSYIGARDAARSLMAAAPKTQPLRKAVIHLASSLKRLEDMIVTDWDKLPTAILPSLTSEDVEIFLSDPDPDPEALNLLVNDAAAILDTIDQKCESFPGQIWGFCLAAWSRPLMEMPLCVSNLP